MAEPKIGWPAYNAQRAEYLKQYHRDRHIRLRDEKIKAARDWYAANKTEALERQKAYRQRNPLTNEQKEARRIKAAVRRALDPAKGKDARHADRAKRRSIGPFLTRAKIAEMLANAVCVSCGSLDNPEIDHIMPIALGGTHDADNLQILCRPCNRSKGSKHPDEWKGRKGCV